MKLFKLKMYKKGDYKIKKRFALIPMVMSNADVIWLSFYYVVKKYDVMIETNNIYHYLMWNFFNVNNWEVELRTVNKLETVDFIILND